MVLTLKRHPRRTKSPAGSFPSNLFSATATESGAQTAKAPATWNTLPGGVVDGGEIVIFAIKPSMWRWLFDSAPWVVLCSALAAVVTVLGRPVLGVSPAVSAQILLMLAFARLGFVMLRWIPTWYVLTNRRIIDVQGVRSARIRSCPLIDVADTYLRESIPEKAAQLGTIVFELDRPDERPYVWQSIQAPYDVLEKVRSTIKNARDFRGMRR